MSRELSSINKLLFYDSETNLLYKQQNAYRHCYSAEKAEIDAAGWISLNIDSGYVSTVSAADLSKAFGSD